MDPKNPKIDIEYNKKNYQFLNNEFFYFVDMDLLLDMSYDAREMFQNIIESQSLSSKKEIIDLTFHIRLT